MEVPGDLIRAEAVDAKRPGDGRTNHPRLRGQGGGSRDRGLAALRPGKSSQNWASGPPGGSLSQTPQGPESSPPQAPRHRRGSCGPRKASQDVP